MSADLNQPSGVAADARSAVAEESATIIDAGPAPVERIRQAKPAALEEVAFDRQAIDGGSVRIVSERMKTELATDVPLNPLRAGAAVARGTLRAEVQEFQSSPVGVDGGDAPKHGAE
jgi:hypothetical protein